jgi:hypothetical protein
MDEKELTEKIMEIIVDKVNKASKEELEEALKIIEKEFLV